MIPGLTIYQQKHGDKFLISSYAVDPEFRFNVSSGLLTSLTEEQMRTSGLDFALRDMEEYSKRVPTPSAFELMTKRQLRQFERNHRSVGMSLQSGGNELWLSPMRPDGKGGAVGEPEDRVVVSLPSTNKAFFEALSLALSRCPQ